MTSTYGQTFPLATIPRRQLICVMTMHTQICKLSKFTTYQPNGGLLGSLEGSCIWERLGGYVLQLSQAEGPEKDGWDGTCCLPEADGRTQD